MGFPSAAWHCRPPLDILPVVMRYRLPAALLVGSALLLAACGGGGGEKTVTFTPTPVARTATPPAVAVPTPPAEFAAYPDAIAAYLSETQGSPSCLAELFSAWSMPQPTFGPPCAAADLDGDGQDEYVVRIADASTTGPPLTETPSADAPPSYGGDVLIMDAADGRFEVVYRAATGADGSPAEALDPTILGTGDYNADGNTEAAIAISRCPADACDTSVLVIGRKGDQYADLFEEPVVVLRTRFSEIAFQDLDGDGAQEIQIQAGAVASVGAGPQRDSVLTYDWDGTSFILADRQSAPSDYLYFVVRDADAAYAAGKSARASSLYKKAAEDTSLKDWKEELGTGARDRDELVPYARFRVYLTQLRLLAPTDTDPALILVGSIEALAQEFPNSLHAQAAQRFSEAYRQQPTTPETAYTSGCTAFVSFLEERRSEFDAAWDYGDANPKRTPGELCPQ